MSLTLTTVTSNGGPLSAAQNDANMNAIMTEVNATEANVSALQTTVASTVSNSSFASSFSGTGGDGKAQVSWSDVINKPTLGNVYPFRISLSGTDQQCVVASGVPFTATIGLNNVVFDPSGVTSTSGNCFTVPLTGYYSINGHAQVYSVSGTPTSIVMAINVMRNGTIAASYCPGENSDTANRNWVLQDNLALTAADVVTFQIAITQTGNSTWAVTANPFTCMSGFLIQQTS